MAVVLRGRGANGEAGQIFGCIRRDGREEAASDPEKAWEAFETEVPGGAGKANALRLRESRQHKIEFWGDSGMMLV